MPTAKVNGINLAYNVKGNGPPLILIIGFASAQNLWYSTVRAFSKSYRVVTFDNRGFGKSDKPPGQRHLPGELHAGLIYSLGWQGQR